ncbi:MAG TPA: hypothetical protein VEL74_22535 [Thermoanaerobaculia bacterium]|nr:hypothetical protein [Thermoanaerobaculia bacterium]
MSQADFSQFEYVLTFLSSRMAPPGWLEEVDPQVKRRHGVAESRPVQQEGQTKDEGVKRQLVVLLGAGCSRQYGLPSFLELLRYLWEDCLREAPEDDMGLEVLRDKLDKFWQGQGPNYRTHMLKRYLRHGRVDGATCPGYVHLARLAKEGYVKAIINMNFDTLLEDAIYHCGVPYRVATSFLVQDDKRIVIYKPHGTVGRVDSEDSIEGLLRAAQEVLDAEKSLETEKDALLRIFNRALEHFQCDGEHLVQAANGKMEGSKTLARLCSLFLGLEEAAPGEIRPELPVLREALESLIRAFRSPVKAKNDLILDIANSDLLSDSEEQRCAQELLTGHDVVSIGYSGVDAKIAAALRAFTSNTDPKDKKLFVVNIAPPDPRLLSVMALRASQDLLIAGRGAAFENFMGYLAKAVERLGMGQATQGERAEEDKKQSKKEKHSPAHMSAMTDAEQKALGHSLRLAQDIRLSMNVAERSRTSIEEHGYKIFNDCLELAQRAGICLNSAEKYLSIAPLFCTTWFITEVIHGQR